MQKTIIALRGSRNVGKTTTIRLAYDELQQQGILKRLGSRSRMNKEVNGAILEIDGMLVGFASKGDDDKILDEFLVDLIAVGCMVIVCATRTRRSPTVRLVERLASEAALAFYVVWIEKDCPQVDHADGNRKMADKIKEAVRQAIAEAQLVEA